MTLNHHNDSYNNLEYIFLLRLRSVTQNRATPRLHLQYIRVQHIKNLEVLHSDIKLVSIKNNWSFDGHQLYLWSSDAF